MAKLAVQAGGDQQNRICGAGCGASRKHHRESICQQGLAVQASRELQGGQGCTLEVQNYQSIPQHFKDAVRQRAA